MAEIGLAASIVGIAGAAATIAKGLYQIASDIGSAGKQVRFIAQDTNAFSHALINLSQLLNSGSASTERARTIARDLVVLCKEILADSQMLLKVLEPLVKLTGRKWKRATLRVRWLFEKSKFAVHRQSLDALKATLTLLVATMTYVDAASANVPEAVSSTLRAQIDSIREEVRLSTQDYEPLLLQIRENVQAIRAEALLEYSKIDRTMQNGPDTEAETATNNPVHRPGVGTTPARDSGVELNQSEDVVMEDNEVGYSTASSETADNLSSYESSDDMVVPVTALAIHTGLQGLPYLQRQTVHFADDVLDMDPSALAATASAQDPQWQAAQARLWGTKLLTGVPSKDMDIPPTIPKLEDTSQHSTVLTTKTTADIERRKRQNQALREAWGKIAYTSFKVGDLALFLPTRNQATRPWAAFNVGAPHYFLREQDSHRLQTRDFLLARITHIEERVVDLSRSVDTHPNDDDSDPEDPNPFELSEGLRWWMVDADENRDGHAPSTPYTGKSTVATAAIEAKGSKATWKSEEGGGDKKKADSDRLLLRRFIPAAFGKTNNKTETETETERI